MARSHPNLSRHLSLGLVCLTGLLSLTLPSVNAQVLPDTIAQTSDTPQVNAVTKQLVGQWKAKQPIDGELLTFIFTSEGRCFFQLNSAATPNGRVNRVGYRIDPSAKPMHIDFILSKTATVETLFELSGSKELRLQLIGTNPGQPRPKEFNKATVFEKISDSATPPENTPSESSSWR